MRKNIKKSLHDAFDQPVPDTLESRMDMLFDTARRKIPDTVYGKSRFRISPVPVCSAVAGLILIGAVILVQYRESPGPAEPSVATTRQAIMEEPVFTRTGMVLTHICIAAQKDGKAVLKARM